MLNLSQLKTPGVYIDEVPKFPPSIAAVDTAIPAFVGYTEKATDKVAGDLLKKPKRITSLLEYEKYFGTTPLVPMNIDVNLDTASGNFGLTLAQVPELKFRLYYAMQLFFANGGGLCYVVSVGNHQASNPSFANLEAGLKELEKVDEVTLLLSPDAAGLDDEGNGDWVDACLDQCRNLQDRFTIADVSDKNTDDASVTANFRGKIKDDIESIKYGAAYYPYLETSLSFNTLNPADGSTKVRVGTYTEDGVVNNAAVANATEDAYQDYESSLLAFESLQGAYENKKQEAEWLEKIKKAIDAASALSSDINIIKSAATKAADGKALPATISGAVDKAAIISAADAASNTANTAASDALDDKNDAETDLGSKESDLNDAVNAAIAAENISFVTIDKLKTTNNGLYNQLLDFANKQRVVLPPSSAIAGIYAQVDATRGVWKAPANIGLSRVIRPTVDITHLFNGELNVNPSTGKSVNVIRSFTGKGTLVWGARTLAGNDNEWRYVNVRRFFIFVEESTKKGTERFVFEPNDANTWIKVKAMIENFLILQWRAGALQGAKPEHAFYVKVGLNETMSPDDILNGRLIVEIGMAVVRPAEFIVLRFMHKLPES